MVQGAVGDGFLSGSVGEPVSKGCGRTAGDNHIYIDKDRDSYCLLPKFDFIFIFYSSYIFTRCVVCITCT